jgi:hypothetical protein
MILWPGPIRRAFLARLCSSVFAGVQGWFGDVVHAVLEKLYEPEGDNPQHRLTMMRIAFLEGFNAW